MIKTITKKRRLGHMAIGAVIFLAVFYAGSMTPLTQAEADMLLEALAVQLEGLGDDIDPLFIATHNISIALAMLIPGIGFLWGSFAGFQTGIMISAMATTLNFPAWMGLALFITPVGILELAAYSLAMSRSWLFGRILVMKKYRTKENIKAMLKPVAIEALIVVVLLIIGGFVESWMITEFGSDSFDLLDKYR